MKSYEWDMRQWKKHINPSGEIIRTKTYSRILPFWDNASIEMVEERKQLAKLTGVNPDDLLCDLDITIQCKYYRRNGRNLKRILRRQEND